MGLSKIALLILPIYIIMYVVYITLNMRVSLTDLQRKKREVTIAIHRGEEIILTEYDKPLALITPINQLSMLKQQEIYRNLLDSKKPTKIVPIQKEKKDR